MRNIAFGFQETGERRRQLKLQIKKASAIPHFALGRDRSPHHCVSPCLFNRLGLRARHRYLLNDLARLAEPVPIADRCVGSSDEAPSPNIPMDPEPGGVAPKPQTSLQTVSDERFWKDGLMQIQGSECPQVSLIAEELTLNRCGCSGTESNLHDKRNRNISSLVAQSRNHDAVGKIVTEK